MVPAKRKLFLINETIIILIKHPEHMLRFLLRQRVNVTLIITEEGFGDQLELFKAQLAISNVEKLNTLHKQCNVYDFFYL